MLCSSTGHILYFVAAFCLSMVQVKKAILWRESVVAAFTWMPSLLMTLETSTPSEVRFEHIYRYFFRNSSHVDSSICTLPRAPDLLAAEY